MPNGIAATVCLFFDTAIDNTGSLDRLDNKPAGKVVKEFLVNTASLWIIAKTQ